VPTYQYACTDCAERVEVVQKFSDDPLTICSSCGGRLRKVFSPVGIVFKGSGFYRTDSRKGSEAALASANGSDSKKSEGSSRGDSSSSGGSSDKSGTSDKKSSDKASSGSSSSDSSSSSSPGSSSPGSSSSGSSGSSGSKVA
jgi:putative FmdB family regulatory protein